MNDDMSTPFKDDRVNRSAPGALSVIDEINFWVLLEIFKKWGIWILGFMILSAILSTLYLQRVVPEFRASTTLEVKQEQTSIFEFSQIEDITANQEFLETQVELLKSQKLIEEVIFSTNLLTDKAFNPDPREGEEALTIQNQIRRAERIFSSRLSINQIGSSRLIKVSFEHSHPGHAARIVNAHVNKFIENELNTKFNSTAYASNFLKERLAAVKSSLEKAERELVAYARENEIISVEDEGGNEVVRSLEFRTVQQLNTELATARSERVAAEQAYTQAENSSFVTEIISDQGLDRLRLQKISLETEYQRNLAIYKPLFPEMIELKNQINLIDSEIGNKTAAIAQGLKADSEAKYKAALNNEKNLQSRVSKLKNNLISQREKTIDYNILRRQVETERTQYEGLLQRLKEISVADEVGTSLVQVIDRAQTPIKPFSPNWFVTILSAIGASGLLAILFAVLYHLIDDRIKLPNDIRDKLGRTVLGVIPWGTWDEGQVENR